MLMRLIPGGLVAYLLAFCAGCYPGGGALGIADVASNPMEKGGSPATPLEHRLTGPYQSGNATVYLIHGREQAADTRFITLDEGLSRQEVKVHETGQVSRLTISNSSEDDLFVQSGDIVKGGRQDRTMAFDLLVSAGAEKMPVDSFCVESGRWSARAGESSARFGSAGNSLVTRDQKLAAKYRANQSEVWNQVSKLQESLTRSLGRPAASEVSPTSLQLTLEDERLQNWAGEFVSGLSPVVEGKDDVIGYALLINGKLNSAEVYASNALFRKVWPRLLRANGMEAIAAMQESVAEQPDAEAQVRALIEAAEKGEPASRKVNERTRFAIYTAQHAVLFETRDEAAGGRWVHRSYLVK